MHYRELENRECGVLKSRYECRLFRQRVVSPHSVPKRVGSIRKRPMVSSQTSYITRTLYYVQDLIKACVEDDYKVNRRFRPK